MRVSDARDPRDPREIQKIVRGVVRKTDEQNKITTKETKRRCFATLPHNEHPGVIYHIFRRFASQFSQEN